MRLKRLEMSGFKSFVDPTKIDLDRGITAIVGPNGCGKSNIVDALRWVLGEHSARHLRGGVMDDLIFQGSESRSPVAICDVELTFAVEKGRLPPPYHERDEIRIRRRLTREGGSDAFINGKTVRIKDVIDLFLDTGISTRAYAIVEQGSIARMVTAKPEERRTIFEEAAGVMKYRSRRREAELRMKDTRQNLDRVLDLLDEVRSQCRSLKQQASRAERFKKMQEEFTQARSISLALRYRDLQQQQQRSSAELATARSAEDEATLALGRGEKSVSEARAKLIAHEQEAERIQDGLRAAERHRADLQQQAERLAGERRLLSERKQALEQRIEEMEQRIEQLRSERARIGEQIEAQDDSPLHQRRQEAAEIVVANQNEVSSQREQRDLLLAEFERLRHSSEQAMKQRQQSELALNRLDERQQQLTQRKAALQSALTRQRNAKQQAEQQLDAATVKRQQSVQLLEQAQSTLEQRRSEREIAARQLDAAESTLREYRGQCHQLRASSRNHEISDALKEEMRSRGGIWMDEVLHVPAGLEAAIAAALRGSSGDLRLPDGAAPGDWRKSMRSAPVALYQQPAASNGISNDKSNDISDQHPSLAAAIGLSPEHPLFTLLNGVQLVDDIDAAETLGICCVSRDGWRREPGGWLIPPAGNRTAERLATQRQLRQAEQQLQEAETAFEHARHAHDEAEQALESQQKAWQQTHIDATDSESEFLAASAASSRASDEIEALERQRSRLDSDLKDVAGERNHWQAQAGAAAETDRQTLIEAQARLDVQNDLLRQSEQRLDQARDALAAAEQTLALFAQARDNLNSQSERLSAEIARLESEISSDRKRLEQASAALENARDQNALADKLATAVAEVEHAHASMNAVRTTGHALQQAQHEAEREERRLRQALQQRLDTRQRIALEQAQHTTRVQDLAGEIMQRCQVEPEHLLAQIEAACDLEDSESIMRRASELEARLERFGPVNLLAIDEYEQASEREGFLAAQASDLEASLTTLGDTISRIDRTTRQRFRAVFDQTNANFKQTFPQLFGGGRAELRLDSDDILSAGVEVIAQPPGKRLQDVTLLSGGEKALTAVALVFSIFKIKPAPFCVLDEVDAPLDDANVGRFADMVRELSDRVQFLAISHNKITMQKSDRLIGVSMPEPGVSKIVAVDLEQAD